MMHPAFAMREIATEGPVCECQHMKPCQLSTHWDLLTDMLHSCVYSTSSPKHLVKMTGLTPGTAYQYRVGDGVTW